MTYIEENELHQAFLDDFSALLKKYNSNFNLEFKKISPFNYSNVPVINFDSQKDRMCSQLDLPSFID